MSYTSVTKSSKVSETDSECSNGTRHHRYNTRSSKNYCGSPRSWTTPRVNKRTKPRVQEKPSSDSMDYCFDPCPPPPKKSWLSSLFSKILYLFLTGILVSILYTQYYINIEMKTIKDDLIKIKGGHRKEDPHTKLSKELDKKCSDTLKLLLKDSVGRPDFALQSSGGKIISVESNPYSSPKTLLGFTLCEGDHGPSTMIQATTAPGECWAFKGQTAKATIQLIDDVMVDAISLEHIPATISPSGTIDTAPKDFKIWGLDKPGDSRKLLGQFKYEENGGTIQTFNINNESNFFKFVEFEVLSNHGNKEFTCVYRVRVHGATRKST